MTFLFGCRRLRSTKPTRHNRRRTGKAGEQLDKAVSELKSSGEAGDTIEKVEKTVKDLTSQATKLSTDYDLPAKAKQALGVAGELADTAIVKVCKRSVEMPCM